MTISEAIIQTARHLFKVFRAFFDRLAETMRPVFKKLAEFARKIQRARVKEMTFSADRRIATAARVWLRTKNRRIKRKQIRLLFPQEGW